MMKLILSLTLIWTLSSTARALRCLLDRGVDTKQRDLIPCNSTDLCATVAIYGISTGTIYQETIRSCSPSSLFSAGKHTFSFSLLNVNMAASVHVCNTDGCNGGDIPYPDIQKKNNLQCFTCNDPYSAECDKTVQCVGVQDRCFSWTVADKDGRTLRTFGCVSANICESASYLKSWPDMPVKLFGEPKCCESSFCNSAWSVRLSVIPLLFGLITLIVY